VLLYVALSGLKIKSNPIPKDFPLVGEFVEPGKQEEGWIL
jgi:hypothetical protein